MYTNSAFGSIDWKTKISLASILPGGAESRTGTDLIDPEPVDRELLEELDKPPPQESGRGPTSERHCNIVDIGFRNDAGFPLSVYWADQLVDVPLTGFSCAERYSFHMGIKAATQGT